MKDINNNETATTNLTPSSNNINFNNKVKNILSNKHKLSDTLSLQRSSLLTREITSLFSEDTPNKKPAIRANRQLGIYQRLSLIRAASVRSPYQLRHRDRSRDTKYALRIIINKGKY